MAISLKHSFTSPKSDGGDDTLVRPSDWNAEHALTQTTGTLLGRTTAGTGATEEITPGSGLSFTALTLAVDPAGSNTHVQFNDSEALGGSAGFTFDKDSNNLIVANTTTIGTNFIANGSGAYPLNNTSGIALGSTTARFNFTGNTISVTGTITSSGNITGSNVNGAIGYFTGLVNAANFITTGNMNAGSTYVTGGMYPASNSSGQILGDGTHRWVITANSLATSGGITTDGSIVPTSNTQTLGSASARWVITANAVVSNTFTVWDWIYPASNTEGYQLGASTRRWVFYANTGNFTGTITTAGGTLTSVGVYPTNNTTGTALGSTTQRWNLIGNTISVSGTITASGNLTCSNVNGGVGFFTGQVNATTFTTTGNINTTSYVYAGANVYANTTTVRIGNSTVQTIIGNTDIRVGNSTVNVVANSLSIVLANSTVSWNISKPTAAEVSTGNYYLGSDGTWQQPAATTDAAGSDTHVQFNDGGTLFGGTAGFTFTKTTNNVTIGNTITVGTNFIANGSVVNPGSNSAAITLGASNARWVMYANSINTPGISANSNGVYPASNSSGTALGGTAYRWVITANTITTSGNITTDGNIVPTSNTQNLGSASARWLLQANNIWVSGACLPQSNTGGTSLGSSDRRWVITANTITTSGDCTLGANVSITANLDVGNVVTAVTKSFLIDHPTKEGMKLRYGSLEGPENGIYVRGRSNCDIVELPEYWVALANAETVTVSLTPIGNTPFLSVYEVRDNKVYVKSASLPIDFYYLVQAERIDVPKLVVEE